MIEGDIAKIPLGINAKDGYAIVDREFAWIDRYNWTKLSVGYAIMGNKSVCMHHFIFGKPEKGYEVDHKNNDRLDNRLNNLRVVTRQQNSMNRKKQSNNKCGYKGVYEVSGRWYAKINIDGRHISLGGHDDKNSAALTYNRAAVRYFGEYAWLNDII